MITNSKPLRPRTLASKEAQAEPAASPAAPAATPAPSNLAPRAAADAHAILPVSLYPKDNTLLFLVNSAQSVLHLYWIKPITGHLIVTVGESAPIQTAVNEQDGASLSIAPGEYTWEVRDADNQIRMGPAHFDVKHSAGKGAGLASLKTILHGSGRKPAAVEFLD